MLSCIKTTRQKLGSPQNLSLEARQKGLETRKQNAVENENNLKAAALIDGLHKQGNPFILLLKN